MRHMKCVLALVLCLSMMVLPALGADGFPKTIVDSANRTVTIDKPVERIVPIVAWSYEPIYILRAQDKIVGVEKGSKVQYSYLPGIGDKPVIGTYKEPDYEKIIELKPDAVIVQPAYQKKVDEKLSPLGIKVICLPFNQQNSFDHDLLILAEMLGPDGEKRAKEFIDWKQSSNNTLKNSVKGISPKVRVYGEWSDTPWMTGSKASGMNDVIIMAGGNNIAEALNPDANSSLRYPTVDSEWVLNENPQVIIFPAFDYYTGYQQNDTINATEFINNAKLRAGLKGTDAVLKNRVYIIDAYLIEAVRGFIGAQYLAKLFYPEEFKNIDPDAVHKEYYEKWLGAPYKGIWIYPQAS